MDARDDASLAISRSHEFAVRALSREIDGAEGRPSRSP